jgi:prepilin-type N-terminal cleavage/methylation domain-containing protein
MTIQNSKIRINTPLCPPLIRGEFKGGNFKFLIFNSRRGGFTLIETVIVMVIVVILAAVVILRNPFGSIKLYSASKKVAGDIRYAQKLAISTQERCGIDFNINGYSVRNITWNTLAKSPGDTCSTDSQNNFVVDFTASRCSNYSNVQITSPATDPIAFNSLGTPVNQWGTMLGSNQTVTLSLSGAGNQNITVEQGTGRVSY